MIVAGVGCRRGASAIDIETAVRSALERAGIAANALALLATPAIKQHETGITMTAAKLGLRVVLISAQDLQAASVGTTTRSTQVMARMGVGSVAEAAALAAAGPGARLMGPRLIAGSATCALAASGKTP